jgi:spermidine/putrescine transport system permease protein
MRRLGWHWAPLAGVFVFLYLPIVTLVVLSFNASKLPFVWGGFSLRWYGELAGDEAIRQGFVNTLIVALGTTVLATVLGTLLAVGLSRFTRSALLEAYSLAPAIVPDLALAIGLLVMFSAVGFALGLFSVLLAHVVFCMAFVAAIVTARLGLTDPSLEEASRDLGAGPVRTFMRITVPTLAPAIIGGALIAFTLSFDEFVIAFFTDGPSTPTLPIVVYSMVRFGVTPVVNALGALLLLVSIVIIVIAQRTSKLTDAV